MAIIVKVVKGLKMPLLMLTLHDVVIFKVLRLLDTKKGRKVAALGPLLKRKFGKLPQMPQNIYQKSFMHVGQCLPTVTGRPIYYSHLKTSKMTTSCSVSKSFETQLAKTRYNKKKSTSN